MKKGDSTDTALHLYKLETEGSIQRSISRNLRLYLTFCVAKFGLTDIPCTLAYLRITPRFVPVDIAHGGDGIIFGSHHLIASCRIPVGFADCTPCRDPSAHRSVVKFALDAGYYFCHPCRPAYTLLGSEFRCSATYQHSKCPQRYDVFLH